MNNIFVILIIISELLLGSYSWLVKTVPTNLSTQLLVRMMTFALGSVVMGLSSGQLLAPNISHLISLGALNTIHILSSYYAYSQLPTTVSLPLFYIYPLINVFLSSVLLNNKFTLSTLPWLLFSFMGALTIVFQKGALSFSPTGIIAILIAALTESLIYIVFKSNYETSHFQGVFHLYFGGLIAVLLARLTNLLEPFDFKSTVWKPLVTFNILFGFIAFSIVTYSIPYMPSELFASLAFFGILSAYIFSEIGKEKKPSTPTIIGSLMIVIGAAAVRYLKIETTN